MLSEGASASSGLDSTGKFGTTPVFLTPGTAVSAKYRGAFCEATVDQLDLKYRLKVQVKGTKTILSVDQTKVISGDPVPNAEIRIQLPLSETCGVATNFEHTAIVLRVTDTSLYTVVFDDGDKRTLRRTQLVIKGERHFKESESLDSLPLTNPEEFRQPVIGQRRKNRSGDSEDNDVEDDTILVDEAEATSQLPADDIQISRLQENISTTSTTHPSVDDQPVPEHQLTDTEVIMGNEEESGRVQPAPPDQTDTPLTFPTLPGGLPGGGQYYHRLLGRLVLIDMSLSAKEIGSPGTSTCVSFVSPSAHSPSDPTNSRRRFTPALVVLPSAMPSIDLRPAHVTGSGKTSKLPSPLVLVRSFKDNRYFSVSVNCLKRLKRAEAVDLAHSHPFLRTAFERALLWLDRYELPSVWGENAVQSLLGTKNWRSTKRGYRLLRRGTEENSEGEKTRSAKHRDRGNEKRFARFQQRNAKPITPKTSHGSTEGETGANTVQPAKSTALMASSTPKRRQSSSIIGTSPGRKRVRLFSTSTTTPARSKRKADNSTGSTQPTEASKTRKLRSFVRDAQPGVGNHSEEDVASVSGSCSSSISSRSSSSVSSSVSLKTSSTSSSNSSDVKSSPSSSTSSTSDISSSSSSLDFEARDRWIAQLYRFMDEGGAPINKAPCLANKDLDLYKLYKIVQNLGGFHRVNAHMKWGYVYSKLGLPHHFAAGPKNLQLAFKRYLYPLDEMSRKLGTDLGELPLSRPRHHSSTTCATTSSTTSLPTLVPSLPALPATNKPASTRTPVSVKTDVGRRRANSPSNSDIPQSTGQPASRSSPGLSPTLSSPPVLSPPLVPLQSLQQASSTDSGLPSISLLTSGPGRKSVELDTKCNRSRSSRDVSINRPVGRAAKKTATDTAQAQKAKGSSPQSGCLGDISEAVLPVTLSTSAFSTVSSFCTAGSSSSTASTVSSVSDDRSVRSVPVTSGVGVLSHHHRLPHPLPPPVVVAIAEASSSDGLATKHHSKVGRCSRSSGSSLRYPVLSHLDLLDTATTLSDCSAKPNRIIPIGSRVRVRCGDRMTYEARILKHIRPQASFTSPNGEGCVGAEPSNLKPLLSWQASNETQYRVHYMGWNPRHDEVVSRSRIVSVIDRARPSTSDLPPSSPSPSLLTAPDRAASAFRTSHSKMASAKTSSAYNSDSDGSNLSSSDHTASDIVTTMAPAVRRRRRLLREALLQCYKPASLSESAVVTTQAVGVVKSEQERCHKHCASHTPLPPENIQAASGKTKNEPEDSVIKRPVLESDEKLPLKTESTSVTCRAGQGSQSPVPSTVITNTPATTATTNPSASSSLHSMKRKSPYALSKKMQHLQQPKSKTLRSRSSTSPVCKARRSSPVPVSTIVTPASTTGVDDQERPKKTLRLSPVSATIKETPKSISATPSSKIDSHRTAKGVKVSSVHSSSSTPDGLVETSTRDKPPVIKAFTTQKRDSHSTDSSAVQQKPRSKSSCSTRGIMTPGRKLSTKPSDCKSGIDDRPSSVNRTKQHDKHLSHGSRARSSLESTPTGKSGEHQQNKVKMSPTTKSKALTGTIKLGSSSALSSRRPAPCSEASSGEDERINKKTFTEVNRPSRKPAGMAMEKSAASSSKPSRQQKVKKLVSTPLAKRPKTSSSSSSSSDTSAPFGKSRRSSRSSSTSSSSTDLYTGLDALPRLTRSQHRQLLGDTPPGSALQTAAPIRSATSVETASTQVVKVESVEKIDEKCDPSQQLACSPDIRCCVAQQITTSTTVSSPLMEVEESTISREAVTATSSALVPIKLDEMCDSPPDSVSISPPNLRPRPANPVVSTAKSTISPRSRKDSTSALSECPATLSDELAAVEGDEDVEEDDQHSDYTVSTDPMKGGGMVLDMSLSPSADIGDLARSPSHSNSSGSSVGECRKLPDHQRVDNEGMATEEAGSVVSHRSRHSHEVSAWGSVGTSEDKKHLSTGSERTKSRSRSRASGAVVGETVTKKSQVTSVKRPSTSQRIQVLDSSPVSSTMESSRSPIVSAGCSPSVAAAKPPVSSHAPPNVACSSQSAPHRLLPSQRRFGGPFYPIDVPDYDQMSSEARCLLLQDRMHRILDAWRSAKQYLKDLDQRSHRNRRLRARLCLDSQQPQQPAATVTAEPVSVGEPTSC